MVRNLSGEIEVVLAAWERACPVARASQSQFRRDQFGNIICFAHYEDDSKGTGWRLEGTGLARHPVATFIRPVARHRE